MILRRTGRIPISLTIVTTFVGLVIVMLGSVLTIDYLSSLRNTLSLVGELATQSSDFVTDELRDHLEPVIRQADWAADLIAAGPFDLGDDQQVGSFLLGALSDLLSSSVARLRVQSRLPVQGLPASLNWRSPRSRSCRAAHSPSWTRRRSPSTRC